MQVARVPTTLLTKRVAQKFSPGLPQNQTCGCWQTPANQTMSFDVMLNASWVVLGLAFGSDRSMWLKEIEILASDDNRTFVPWGGYVMSNFTSASLALFTYPIRARLFRVVVRKYANHLITSTSGYQISPVQALVSSDQPFGCSCPTLSNGECCPFLNMTIRNDKCVWCMDPADIQTKVIDGCAKCKVGTFEFRGKCYQNRSLTQQPSNSLSVGHAWSDGIDWRVQVNYTTDKETMILLFLTNKSTRNYPCIRKDNLTISSYLSTTCCLNEYFSENQNNTTIPPYSPILWNFTPPTDASDYSQKVTPNSNQNCQINSTLNPPAISIEQFVQFDRGRQQVTLSFTEREIRSWATCENDACQGSIGALFMTFPTPLSTELFLPHLLLQPLLFKMAIPSLVCTTARTLPTLARAELHYYMITDTYTVRILGVDFKSTNGVKFQWAVSNTINDWTTAAAADPQEIIIAGPPADTASLRITDGITTLRIDPPLTPVVHNSVKQSTLMGILVDVAYGFGFSKKPSSGDTDQIVIITAKSTQPARLKRLASTNLAGDTTVYTSAKGFISDPKRVMDLGVSCYQDKSLMTKWLTQSMQLLDTQGLPCAAFIQRSCHMIMTGEVAKGFWLIPWRGALSFDRTALVGVEVVAEFA
jgi:hypothetical protein